MQKHPRAFWLQLVASVESGANLLAVAERHGVNPTTLAWWRTMIRKEQRAAKPTLLPVVLRDSPSLPACSSSAPLELLVGEATLRIPTGSDIAYVAALVRALGQTC